MSYVWFTFKLGIRRHRLLSSGPTAAGFFRNTSDWPASGIILHVKVCKREKEGYIRLSTGKSKSKMADNNSNRTNGQKSVNRNRNFIKLRLLTS